MTKSRASGKKKLVEIVITKEYEGKKLISRWKTTTIKRVINGNMVAYIKQDPKNFYSVYFSGNKIHER